MTEKLTIDHILDLKENSWTYRWDKDRSKRRRTPDIHKLCAFINEHFAGKLTARLQPWGVTPTRKVGRFISHTGKRREGYRLEVFRPDDDIFNPFWWHKTAETYSTNWDVIDQIVKWHRNLESGKPLDDFGS